MELFYFIYQKVYTFPIERYESFHSMITILN